MPFVNAVRSLPQSARYAKATAKLGLLALKGDMAIAVYPLFAFILVLASLTLVNDLITAATNWLADEPIFKPGDRAVQDTFGIVSVILFYIYLSVMTGIFTSVVVASVIAELDGHHAPLLKGIKVTLHNFLRIVGFSALSIVLIPLGFLAQKDKWHNKPHDVVGSSFSLNMAQLAPVILSSKQGVLDTIRTSISILGIAWKENLIIKLSMYALIILLGVISFLPAYLENNWMDQYSAGAVSWIVSVLIFVSFLVMTRVMASVFTATLYWRITNSKS